ncbi:serine protease [Kineosphaera limosa]|uniref:Putative peptidase S8 family protein n=1 Tax=Kineosphaera limosa NBRC 100340 TaxID=1184609 RepID=K6WUG7_9MICO|nr:S8 family serine peptidase [Kineosphaera limosa]NYD99849.1 serine protease [Kineosphaera limosa]GAB97476.1 putative peptidase S8 family protein [Kineosphaera limosa NBRC 100340]
MSRTTRWIGVAAAAALTAAGLAPIGSYGASALGAPAGVPAAAAPTAKAQLTGRVMVKFSPKVTTPAARAQRIAVADASVDADLEVAGQASAGVTIVEGASPAEAAFAAAVIRKQADVAYASPERLYQITAPAEYLGGTNMGSTGSGVDAAGAHSKTTGTGVTVAVLDTGQVANHEALASQTAAGYDFASVNDHDGTAGRDADPAEPVMESGATCDNGKTPRQSWHGTHVAGSVAAVAPGAKIVPVRVGGHCGIGGQDLMDGILWASGISVAGAPTNANPAQVINMSLGHVGGCDPYEQDIINQARSRNVAIVAAAGNDNSSALHSPGACNGVINVAAVTPTGAKASFSNYGSKVDVSAPGTNIVSAVGPSTSSFAPMQGTSMAAPHVAGIAALVRAAYPALTPDQVESSIISSAKPFGGPCTGCGSGVANAPASLTAAENGGNGTVVSSISPLAGKTSGGDTVTLTGLGLDKTTEVWFGSAKAKMSSRSATSVVVKAPKGPAGAAAVRIVTPTTTATSSYIYAVVPAVKKYAPKTLSPDGGELTITGVGFNADAKVTFNGTAVTVKSASDTAIVVTAPANTTTTKATVSVVVTANELPSKASKFTYAVPKPKLKTTVKTLDPAGADVSFTGNDLDKIAKVSVNGTELAADKWAYIGADKSLTVKVPTLAFKAKPVAQIVATTKWGAPTNRISLKYLVPKTALKAPKAALTPEGGDAVFTGTNLDQITVVKVGGTELVKGTGWTVSDGKDSLTVKIPAQSTTTKAVPVQVVTPYIELKPVNVKIAVPKVKR